MNQDVLPSYKIFNVKIHFKLGYELIFSPEMMKTITKHSNFVVLRLSHYVYIIFPKNGHINVSGIKTFHDINSALSVFNSHFHTTVQASNIKIDNTTAHGRFNVDKVQLTKLASCNPHEHFNISIRPYYFPSALLRPKVLQSSTSSQTVTTCLLFSNGKFNIIGGKSIKTIEHTLYQLCVLMKTLSLTT